MILCACTTRTASAEQNLLGQSAPDFMLKDLTGKPLRLASFRGEVVLLNFWATWCAPCLIEMPVFARWARQYASQGFQVIGISMDDDAAQAQSAIRRLNAEYPMAMGNEHLAARYGGVLGLPLSYLIDRKGIVRARYKGETDPKIIERRLKELLA